MTPSDPADIVEEARKRMALLTKVYHPTPESQTADDIVLFRRLADEITRLREELLLADPEGVYVAAPHPSPLGAEGDWVLVPREPTDEMRRAGQIAGDDKLWKWRGESVRPDGAGLDGMTAIVADAYLAMIAAAPPLASALSHHSPPSVKEVAKAAEDAWEAWTPLFPRSGLRYAFISGFKASALPAKRAPTVEAT